MGQSIYQAEGKKGWFFKDPDTLQVYGPFDSRKQAREKRAEIFVRDMDERKPTVLPTATNH